MSKLMYRRYVDHRMTIDLVIAMPECRECQEKVKEIIMDDIFTDVKFGYHWGAEGQPLKIFFPNDLDPAYDLWGHAEEKVEALRKAGFRVL